MGRKGPRITNGSFGPPLFVRDFSVGPYCLGCDLAVCYFFSRLSGALSWAILLIFSFSDPAYCRFALWITGFFPQFSKLLFVLQ
jgi:hypothetical protein